MALRNVHGSSSCTVIWWWRTVGIRTVTWTRQPEPESRSHGSSCSRCGGFLKIFCSAPQWRGVLEISCLCISSSCSYQVMKDHQDQLHQAIRIPEILSLIFSNASSPDLASYARVCKSWMDPALDRLWEDLDEDPTVAFRLLHLWNWMRIRFHKYETYHPLDIYSPNPAPSMDSYRNSLKR